MNIGIVGHEGAKFTAATEMAARALIYKLLEPPDAALVSGHCHLGGIDIWAEEIATDLGRPMNIFPPASLSWESGYKPRNLRIARVSDVVHNILVAKLPPDYKGMKFSFCYHCHTDAHVKSGGCWTALQARKLGKPAHWHVLPTLM